MESTIMRWTSFSAIKRSRDSSCCKKPSQVSSVRTWTRSAIKASCPVSLERDGYRHFAISISLLDGKVPLNTWTRVASFHQITPQEYFGVILFPLHHYLFVTVWPRRKLQCPGKQYSPPYHPQKWALLSPHSIGCRTESCHNQEALQPVVVED